MSVVIEIRLHFQLHSVHTGAVQVFKKAISESEETNIESDLDYF